MTPPTSVLQPRCVTRVTTAEALRATVEIGHLVASRYALCGPDGCAERARWCRTVASLYVWPIRAHPRPTHARRLQQTAFIMRVYPERSATLTRSLENERTAASADVSSRHPRPPGPTPGFGRHRPPGSSPDTCHDGLRRLVPSYYGASPGRVCWELWLLTQAASQATR